MGDSGRKLLDTTRALGGLPEAAPTLATDGHEITLTGVAGKVSPEYLSVMFDLTGGTSVEIRTWLYYPDVVNVANWQEVSVNTISDAIATANTFLVVPSLGATRVAFIVQSQVGGVTDISYTIRNISQEDAQIMVASGFGSPAILTDVNLAQVDGVVVSAAAGIQDVAVTSAPETDVDLMKVGGVAVSAAGGIQDVAVTSAPETDVDIMKVGGVAVSAAGGIQDVAVTSIPETSVNIVKLGGNAVISGGANGVFAVGGPSAQGAAATGNPLQAGSVYQSTPPTLTNGQGGAFWIDNVARLGTINFGDVADDVADTSTGVVKVGGRAYQTLTGISDPLDRAHLAFDMYRRLHVRPASYNELLDALRASVNTIANDYSVSPDTWIDATNVAAGPLYYPNSDGFVIGTKTFLAITFEIEDGAMAFEVSNGNNWVDATAMMVWTANGDSGWADTDFTEPGSGTPVDFAVTWDHIRFERIRAVFTRSDSANTVRIDAMYGAN